MLSACGGGDGRLAALALAHAVVVPSNTLASVAVSPALRAGRVAALATLALCHACGTLLARRGGAVALALALVAVALAREVALAIERTSTPGGEYERADWRGAGASYASEDADLEPSACCDARLLRVAEASAPASPSVDDRQDDGASSEESADAATDRDAMLAPQGAAPSAGGAY